MRLIILIKSQTFTGIFKIKFVNPFKHIQLLVPLSVVCFSVKKSRNKRKYNLYLLILHKAMLSP